MKTKRCTLKRGSNNNPVPDLIEVGLKSGVIYKEVDGKVKKLYISKT